MHIVLTTPRAAQPINASFRPTASARVAQVRFVARRVATTAAPSAAPTHRRAAFLVHPWQQRHPLRTRDAVWQALIRLALLNVLAVVSLCAITALAQTAGAKVVGNAMPMYRLYSPELGGHVYTNRAEGYAQLVTIGWRPEGSTFRVLESAGTIDGMATVPLIRLWNDKLGRHVMTTDLTEANLFANQGWKNEGARGYVLPVVNASATANTVPLYRMYSPYFKSYLYLNNAKDRDAVAAAGWTYEKIIGYALPMTSLPLTAKDASRLLTQATFGANATELKRVNQMGIEAWLDDQLLRPAASHMDYINAAKARRATATSSGKYAEEDSYEAIWQQWLWGQDQLRARMSFALSEIMVISNTAPDIYPEAMSTYMDVLNKHAFGNYRDLLEAVTLTPAMGYYLNMMGSEKEDAKSKKMPNENYAREVLQLFSVGLVQLNPDGSRKLGSDGKPLATYDEDTVKGFAQAFTGWHFAGNDNTKADKFAKPKENWVQPLIAWPSKHATGTKKLLDGSVLPAGQTPEADLKAALDNIANHPNVGPFIGKQLIQRFVTSNPSPAYVARVSGVFDNNGKGVRGDLGATLKAVLTDIEARDVVKATDPMWGKQREPVIRFANVLRAFDVTSKNGRNKIHYLDSSDNALGQSPLLAPSVFNFFSPTYTRPGKLAQAGMVAPEFQITNEIQTIGTANFFYQLIKNEGYGSGDSKVRLDLSLAKGMANDAVKLTDYLAGLLSHGELSAATRSQILDAVNALPIKGNNGQGSSNERTARVRAALTLMVLSPDFVIQQ
jgi:uncharacterized protein (DUF1800 family)